MEALIGSLAADRDEGVDAFGTSMIVSGGTVDRVIRPARAERAADRRDTLWARTVGEPTR